MPLLGNLGQVSIDHPELDYMRWGKEYREYGGLGSINKT
jgi:hypothetical protein